MNVKVQHLLPILFLRNKKSTLQALSTRVNNQPHTFTPQLVHILLPIDGDMTGLTLIEAYL